MVRRAWPLLFVLAACGQALPVGRPPQPDFPTVAASVESVPVKGYRVKVKLRGGDVIVGELLAADAKTITVLWDGITTFPANVIERVDVVLYSTTATMSVLGPWAGVATASALATHFFVIILSGPLWTLVDLLVLVPPLTNRERFAETDRDFGALDVYARFPQGLPPAYAARARPY